VYYAGVKRGVPTFFVEADVTYVLVGFIAWFYMTLFHELSHAFFAWRRGAKVTGVYPYWHWYWWQVDLKEGQIYRCVVGLPPPIGKPPHANAKFRFAGYTWKGGEPWQPVEALAPVLMDTVTFTLALLVLAFGGMDPVYPCLFIVAAAIDLGIWIAGFFGRNFNSDGRRYRRFGGE
jgi:hypothetical protein